MTEEQILETAVRTLDSHKAEHLLVLDISGLTSIADRFLLASGSSAAQVRALADYLEEALGRLGIAPRRSDGYAAGDWITLDYGDLIVHIFRREVRAFYDLEHLWCDAPAADIRAWLLPNDGDTQEG